MTDWLVDTSVSGGWGLPLACQDSNAAGSPIETVALSDNHPAGGTPRRCGERIGAWPGDALSVERDNLLQAMSRCLYVTRLARLRAASAQSQEFSDRSILHTEEMVKP
jgi:hypothetical protein